MVEERLLVIEGEGDLRGRRPRFYGGTILVLLPTLLAGFDSDCTCRIAGGGSIGKWAR